MPNWVQKTTWGALICLFCGSLVAQVGQTFFCTEPTCKKHEHTPVETKELSNTISFISTIGSSGTVSGMSPYFTYTNIPFRKFTEES